MRKTLLLGFALFLFCGLTAVAGQVKIGMTPKFTGVDYFIACENGAKKAAADLGVMLDWQGDPSGQESVAKQQATIQTFIDKGYDAIVVSALDASSYAPTLRQAMEEGIKVVTFDADVVPDARDAFVNGTTEDEMAIAMFKGILAEQPKGGVLAITSTDPNASNQNARIDSIMKEYNANKDTLYKNYSFYPNIIYAGNNQAEADTKVNTLLTQESNLVAVFALSSMAGPAAGKACRDLGKPIGSISIQTISVPVTSLDDMKSGLIKNVVLWQPYDMAYLAVEYAKDLVEGKIDKSAKTYASSLVGKAKIGNEKYDAPHNVLADNVVILGSAILYNLDNVGGFKGYPDAGSGF
jgi:ABC-type sugar transport system substrate-binding protein